MPITYSSDSSVNWDDEPDLAGLKSAWDILAVDIDQSLALFGNLADKGSIMSMVYIGRVFDIGKHVNRDAAKAKYWYKGAADKGSIEASYYLGRLYLECHNSDEAYKLFEFGANRGYGPSMNALGIMYMKGIDGRKDVSKAIKILRAAVDVGHVYAKRNYLFCICAAPWGFMQSYMV